MSESGKIVAAEPRENLIPKVMNPNWLVALLLAPIAAMVGSGIAMDNASGDAATGWALLMMALTLGFVVALIVFIVKVAGLRGKISAASFRIGEALNREYGLTVSDPKILILHDKAKPRLNPYEIPAADPYGRPITITISTDSTGTRVVPAVVSLNGKPV